MHFLIRFGGGGYTLERAEEMDMDELAWYVNKLAGQLEDEHRAREEQVRRMQAKTRSRPARRR